HHHYFNAMQTAVTRVADGTLVTAPSAELLSPLTGAILIGASHAAIDDTAIDEAAGPGIEAAGDHGGARLVEGRQSLAAVTHKQVGFGHAKKSKPLEAGIS